MRRTVLVGAWLWRLARLAVVGLLACAAPAWAVPPKAITVVMDDDYPPYVFHDASGHAQGLLVDQWALWSQRTGIEVRLQPMDWAKAQKALLAGEADVIDTMFETEARRKLYDFSAPHARIDVPIFFHQSVSGIVDAASLTGFTVGVKEGDACIEVLHRRGVQNLKPYASYTAITAAAAAGDLRVFCVDQPPGLYLLNLLGVESKFRHTLPLYSGEFHRAVRKGQTELLALVNDGFSRITEGERRELEEKWFGDGLGLESSLSRIGDWALLGGAVVASLAALLVAWTQTLRRRVAARTDELDRKSVV